MTRMTMFLALVFLAACSNGEFDALNLVSEIAASPHSGTH